MDNSINYFHKGKLQVASRIVSDLRNICEGKIKKELDDAYYAINRADHLLINKKQKYYDGIEIESVTYKNMEYQVGNRRNDLIELYLNKKFVKTVNIKKLTRIKYK